MARRRAALVFLFFGLFYALTSSFRDRVQLPDEEYVLLVTERLVTGRPLYLPDDVPKFPGAVDMGKDRKAYSAFQIGQSLLFAPFSFTARHLIAFSEPFSAAKFGTKERYQLWLDREARSYLYLCPILLSALSCAILFLFALRLGFSDRTSLILTLIYGLGTMVWPYSKYLLTEASQNVLLLASVYLLYLQRHKGEFGAKTMAAAGFLFGLLITIRAPFVILLPVLGLYWFFRNRDRRLLPPLIAFLIPMGVAVLPQLFYDYIRFNNTLSLGYTEAGFTTPLYVGIFGYLFSPGKSFFLYTPVAILSFFGARAFWKRSQNEALLFLVLMILIPIKFAGWWVWSGDPCWGPRYLLVLTPFVILPMGEVIEKAIHEVRMWRRALISLFFAVSIFIQLLAVTVHYHHYLGFVRQNGSFVPPSNLTRSMRPIIGAFPIRDRFFETEFVPEYSPILGHWWVIQSMLTDEESAWRNVPWRRFINPKLAEGAILEAKWDFWITDLFREGLHWSSIRLILGAVALLIVLTIVGQELFVTVISPPKRE